MEDLKFIGIFLLINFLIFSLGYLVNIKHQPNPFLAFSKNVRDLRSFLVELYVRRTSDFLRISLDFSILFFLFKFLSFSSNVSAIILSIVCIISLILVSYIFIMKFVFRRQPLILSDFEFLKVGLTLAKGKKYIGILFIFILIVFFYYIFHSLISQLLFISPNNITTYTILLSCLILGGKEILSFPYDYYHERVFLSPFMHLFKNYNYSKKYISLLNFSEEQILSKNYYKDIKLTEKPDITIVSVESLGAIIYNKDVFIEVDSLLKKFEEIFKEKGISFASTLSKPPQFAGGSWLSIGSFLYGYKFENDIQYDVLFKRSSNFHQYESFLHFLNKQGYDTYLTATLGGYKESDVDWDRLNKVYPVKKIIKYQDLNYVGKTLKFLGFSFSVPDQYSIWKSHELIKSESKNPNCNLFITLNSHCNWHSPLSIAEDYEELNSLDFNTTEDSSVPKLENYKKAICYQLEMLLDYIDKNPDRIYILFGDHQPPYITNESQGFETPVYVLYKNKNLIKSFVDLGFQETLNEISSEKSINHEAFYSVLMKSMVSNFTNKSHNIDIFNYGVKF